jgi:hypothetical protein
MLLIYGLVPYLIATGFGEVMIILTYSLIKMKIYKNKAISIKKEWLNIIESQDYIEITQDQTAIKYNSPLIIPQIYQKYEVSTHAHDLQIKQNRLEKLEQFIENIPEPSENIGKREKIKYQLIGKPCPKCGTIIDFGDFCYECEIRFCPICGMENNQFSQYCICGAFLPDLREEFELKFEKQ